MSENEERKESKPFSSLRLEPWEIEAIVQSFRESFGRGEIRLFGSRIDPRRRGGDIDLYVLPRDGAKDLGKTRVDFLVRLKGRIGERQIDLVIDRGSDRPIDRVAKEKGVVLWRD
jgi:predicted nucleotidyltransferase